MKWKLTLAGRRWHLAWFCLIIILGCGTRILHAQPELTTMRLDAPMAAAAVSPDGHYVAVNVGHSIQHRDGSWTNTEWIEILNPSSSSVVARVDIPSAPLLKNAPVSSTDGFISYCNDGHYLAAYDLIGTVYVFNAKTYRTVSTIHLGNLRMQDAHGSVLGISMACSARGSVFAFSAYGGRFGWGLLRVFDLKTGAQIAELNQDSSSGEQFTAIDISPSGSKLAILLTNPKGTALRGPDIEVRGTKRLKLRNALSTGDAPRGMAFAGEPEVVTIQPKTSRSKPALRVWNLESGKEVKRLSDTRVGVDWPVSSSADGKMILGYLPTYGECRFCGGLEGRRTVKKQQFAVWDNRTGSEIFRSEPFTPIVDPLGPRCVLSQDGTVVMVYWPDNVITPRLFSIRPEEKPQRNAKTRASSLPPIHHHWKGSS